MIELPRVGWRHLWHWDHDLFHEVGLREAPSVITEARPVLVTASAGETCAVSGDGVSCAGLHGV